MNSINDNSKIGKNELIITVEINDIDTNKKIYFLDNTEQKLLEGEEMKPHYHDNLSEITAENTKLYINGKQKKKYEKYFKPKSKGTYTIKLCFNFKIKNCYCMFAECDKITHIDLSSFNTQDVTDMGRMFFKCRNLVSVNLSSFDTRKVENMGFMFCRCENLTIIDLSKFNTQKVTNMQLMFFKCEKLMKLDLSSFNTENTENMERMFADCEKLKKIELSSFNTRKVSKMVKIFSGCKNLRTVNLSTFEFNGIISMMENMLNQCDKLKVTKINRKFYDKFKRLSKEKSIHIIEI